MLYYCISLQLIRSDFLIYSLGPSQNVSISYEQLRFFTLNGINIVTRKAPVTKTSGQIKIGNNKKEESRPVFPVFI